MTAVVRSNVLRYSTREPESLFFAIHLPRAAGFDSGTSTPIASASSTMVDGRTAPSRWSCSDTLGRLRRDAPWMVTSPFASIDMGIPLGRGFAVFRLAVRGSGRDALAHDRTG